MSDIVHIIDTDVRVVEYEGQRVVTLRQIDELHQRAEGQARTQFNRNRRRFMQGRDYFTLTSGQIDTMSLEGLFPPRTARGHLLTESGYQKVVKGWNDDRSWAVHDALQDAYFKRKALLPSDDSLLFLMGEQLFTLQDELKLLRQDVARLQQTNDSLQSIATAIRLQMITPQQLQAALQAATTHVRNWMPKVIEQITESVFDRLHGSVDATRRAVWGAYNRARDEGMAMAFVPREGGLTAYEVCLKVLSPEEIHARTTGDVQRELDAQADERGWVRGRAPARTRSGKGSPAYPEAGVNHWLAEGGTDFIRAPYSQGVGCRHLVGHHPCAPSFSIRERPRKLRRTCEPSGRKPNVAI